MFSNLWPDFIINFNLVAYILVPIGIYLVYRRSVRNYDFWAKQGITGPKPYPVLGNAYSFLLTPRPLLEIQWLKTYGKIHGIFIGNRPVLVVAEPELIKQILVKDFEVFSERNCGVTARHPILKNNLVEAKAEGWRRIRTIVTPAFSSFRMKKMFPLVRECVIEFLEVLDNSSIDCVDNRSELNLVEAFGNLTMDVIATCAFATKVNAHRDPDNLFVKNARIIAKPNMAKTVAIQLLPKFVVNFLQIKSIFNEESNQFFFDLIRVILKQRKTGSADAFDDFIQLLLKAEQNLLDPDEEQDNHQAVNGKDRVLIPRSSVAKYILEDEMLAQAWVFFMAGYETTSSALAFATYELALNDDIQRKLYEEVLTSIDSNGDIDYDLLSRLPYLDSVVSETLRMHSPFIRVGRRAMSDYILGYTGIRIKKFEQVEIPIYAIHMSEEFYPDPEKFDPDRFMPERRRQLIPYTYLPFGGGPRNCIGMRFSLMEIKLCLTQMIQRYRFVPTDKTDDPVKFRKSWFLNAAKRLIVGIEKRN